ncbi:MAG: TonB-dependent receptor [Putridiphycobacter sp.]|nr:TonB-dependent receptor [Putridiphycobacter sp.]
MKAYKLLLVLFLIILNHYSVHAQTNAIEGLVLSNKKVLPFADVIIKELNVGVKTNVEGRFLITDLPNGQYHVQVRSIGFDNQEQEISISNSDSTLYLTFELSSSAHVFEEVVVTGTKTEKRQTESAVIVNVLSSTTLDNVQACNLSEGLKFQPGLRVETDCQTCNYTQLRMNGLGGGYSQILVNGRPIFSPLTGLYGMEQMPVNMIERIEVVRGGGSSLYGSSAIGGTVNVITKIPRKNSFALNYNYHSIAGQTNDHQLLGNGTLINKNKKTGISVFLNHRNRGMYDHNTDNYSELPQIINTSFGTNFFILPTLNQKIEVSLSYLNEYRYGGEITDKQAFLAQQAEERTHDVWMGSVDYQVNFNENKSSFILYSALQNTDRSHYTGILPSDATLFVKHIANPPYGISSVSTYNVGFQLNHKIKNFKFGSNVFTLGGEYIYDDVYDGIPAYNYLIDQITENFGVFLQSDWELRENLNLLTGLRTDFHSLVNQPILNPRVSLLYKYKKHTQFRFNYGTGFRAPQAFDADLHIAFAGGGVSRVSLSPELGPEKSNSYGASINYDRPANRFIAGFTLEGFYTRLQEAFFLKNIGKDDFGERFEKQNGQGATVKGITVELRANYNKKVQLESGYTIQNSLFDSAVTVIDGLPNQKVFMRTPNQYGFAVLTYAPLQVVNFTVNYVYTGAMIIPHFAGAPNQTEDELFESPNFSELNAKFSYVHNIKRCKLNLEFYGGVKNIFNAYQNNFDTGKNRDSNFIYGPAQPRTFYTGIKISGQ